MYARTVEGQTLTFAVSGKLWENSLVMIDQETESLWSHLLGEAMEGPLRGTALEIIPSTMTTWREWKQRWPETTLVVMERSSSNYDLSFHNPDNGLSICLAQGDQARAWSFAPLFDRELANDFLGDLPVLVTFHRPSFTAMIFVRRLDDQLLTFELDAGRLRDRGTGSRWDPLTGKAIDGPLAGRQLRKLPAIVSDSAAWSVYHPGNTFWSPEAEGVVP